MILTYHESVWRNADSRPFAVRHLDRDCHVHLPAGFPPFGVVVTIAAAILNIQHQSVGGFTRRLIFNDDLRAYGYYKVCFER